MPERAESNEAEGAVSMQKMDDPYELARKIHEGHDVLLAKVCDIIGATPSSVVEKAETYMRRLHDAEEAVDRLSRHARLWRALAEAREEVHQRFVAVVREVTDDI